MQRTRQPQRGIAALLVLALVTLTVSDAAAQAPTPSQRQARVVRLPFPQDDGTLTPYTFELGYALLTLVYDTLLWRDEQGIPRPWLARSVEQSPDARRVTVRLASGARWHDGTPVTSADVVFTFGFVANHPHPRFTPQVDAIERVEAPDPSTAVFVLNRPSPGFSDQPLADVPLLPAHVWKDLPGSRLAPAGLPVGSGPYRLVEHVPGQGYRFEANAGYFRGPPAVQTIEVSFIDNAEATLRALERRQVDMIPLSLPEAAARRFETLGTRVKRGPGYLGTVLLFNLRRPPFDRVEARRAVAASLDLARIAAIVGHATPAQRGYLHPASPWSPEAPLQPSSPPAGAGARTSLPPLRVLAPDNDPVKLEAARQVVLGLRRAGAAADVMEVNRQAMSRALGEDGSTPSFDVAVGTSPPLASYDPDFLRLVFGSDPRQAPLNYSGYKSAAFDSIEDRVATAIDPDARRAAVGDALRLLADDVPVLPLFFSNGAYTYRPAIFDGWVFVKGAGILDKRSFMTSPSTPPPVPGGGTGVPTTSDRSPLWLLALGLAGVAGLIALVALFPRRR